MKPIFDPFEDLGAYTFVHTLSAYPYDERVHYAPRLHVQVKLSRSVDTFFSSRMGHVWVSCFS